MRLSPFHAGWRIDRKNGYTYYSSRYARMYWNRHFIIRSSMRQRYEHCTPLLFGGAASKSKPKTTTTGRRRRRRRLWGGHQGGQRSRMAGGVRAWMACYANKAKWILWGVQYNKTSWCAGSGGYGATVCVVRKKKSMQQIAIFKKGPRGAPMMMGTTALLVRLYWAYTENKVIEPASILSMLG